jgi:hypothetical protein
MEQIIVKWWVQIKSSEGNSFYAFSIFWCKTKRFWIKPNQGQRKNQFQWLFCHDYLWNNIFNFDFYSQQPSSDIFIKAIDFFE